MENFARLYVLNTKLWSSNFIELDVCVEDPFLQICLHYVEQYSIAPEGYNMAVKLCLFCHLKKLLPLSAIRTRITSQVLINLRGTGVG